MPFSDWLLKFDGLQEEGAVSVWLRRLLLILAFASLERKYGVIHRSGNLS